MFGYNQDNHTFAHQLPHDLWQMAATLGVDFWDIVKAFAQYGPPIVVAIITAATTGNWSPVWATWGPDILPLIQRILTDLGINATPVLPPVTP